MNLPKFLVLGTLDFIKEGSGYDVKTELNKKQVENWTDIKSGSIYFAIKKLEEEGMIREVRKERDNNFPIKNIYSITDDGRELFDKLQEEAFLGLFPQFYGFKLALKFNSRKTNTEIIEFAKKAILKINSIIKKMNSHKYDDNGSFFSDEFFIEHDLLIYEQEKFWINKVISLLEKESH